MPNPNQPDPTPAVTPDTMPVDPPSAIPDQQPEPTPPEPTKEAEPAAKALADDPEFQEGLDAALSDEPAPKREGKKPEAPKAEEPAKPGDEKPKDEPKPEPTPEEKAEADRKAQVEEEAKGLGLKDKARERFHQLNDTIAKQAPLVSVLEKAGVKDVATLEQMVGNAQAAVDIVGMVRETGANAEQYTMALDYLAEANKAARGDLAAAQKCWDWMASEMKNLAPLLGKEVAGIVDPLAEHPDLQKDLDDERITRERALELAAARNRGKVESTVKKAGEDAQRQTEAQQQAINEGKAALTALGHELAGNTPESRALYQRLGPQLVAAVKEISTTLPPDQWVNAVRVVYKQLAAVPAPAPAAKPAPAGNQGPVRPSGPTPHLTKAAFKDPFEALEAGIAAADAQGG